MPVNLDVLESAIRNAVPVAHLEIEDQSNGCGDNYAIVLVSEVSHRFSLILDYNTWSSQKLITGVRREVDLG